MGKDIRMRKQRKDAQETRQRLLAAAAEVFAERGFWETTHAEICRKAHANIAAVNYHFGGKENLYVQAWKHAFERSLQAHPADGGVATDAPVPERLRGWILAFMQRIVDPDNYEVEIMHKEMANPTGLLNETMHRVLEPMRQHTLSIVRELLGHGADERQIHFCEMSIMGQCFGPLLHLRRARKTPGAAPPSGPPIHFAVEELADHIARFSLAGVRGVRDTAETPSKSVKPRRQGGRVSKPRRS
jgi:TetR/AcrR family transcriptional regulator, regulator of cefoperazone and chloramphenicol sensitivity